MGLFCLAVGLLVIAATAASACEQPHIVYIMADDLGWRDVSWNSDDMYTPNLDRLRREGVELTNHYMQAACSASRVAFLTGYYAYRMGMQRNEVPQYFRYGYTVYTNVAKYFRHRYTVYTNVAAFQIQVYRVQKCPCISGRGIQYTEMPQYLGTGILTLRALLSGTFLQTLPDLVTPLKGHS